MGEIRHIMTLLNEIQIQGRTRSMEEISDCLGSNDSEVEFVQQATEHTSLDLKKEVKA